MINFAAFSDAMEGDDDMISMLIELYTVEHGDDVEKMKTLYANDALEDLFMTVHSLKGVLLTLCEETATQQLEAIEVLCKRGEKPAPNVMTEMYNEIKNINDQVATLPIAN
ncbi:Hpt domain-containing protein [Photobacterium japonica]|uniref:Hpt domain-containing protein n=1 Tax=Photobacterium japonica TaxID=2910235 RepID=UPI003D0FC9DB